MVSIFQITAFLNSQLFSDGCATKGLCDVQRIHEFATKLANQGRVMESGCLADPPHAINRSSIKELPARKRNAMFV
jgi:hypothetical protein